MSLIFHTNKSALFLVFLNLISFKIFKRSLQEILDYLIRFFYVSPQQTSIITTKLFVLLHLVTRDSLKSLFPAQEQEETVPSILIIEKPFFLLCNSSCYLITHMNACIRNWFKIMYLESFLIFQNDITSKLEFISKNNNTRKEG